MFAIAGILCLGVFAPGAAAAPGASAGTVPSPKMFGYAAGPGQRDGPRRARRTTRRRRTAGKAACKYSGARDVIFCVTNPEVRSCVKAAVTVALLAGTAGEGDAEVAAERSDFLSAGSILVS